MASPRTLNRRSRPITHGIRDGYTLCGITVNAQTWAEVGENDTPRRCEACTGVPSGGVDTTGLLDLGLSYPQINFWCRKRYLRSIDPEPGSGHKRFFPVEEVKMAAAMLRLVSAGLPPAAAYHAIRNDGELAPGVRVVVDEAAA